jgi:DNA-binding MarR family transcriptional regulator
MIPRLRDAPLDQKLSPSAMRVYLAFVTDDELQLSPVEWTARKQEAIALRLRLSLRTVESAVASLIRLGYIEAGTRLPGSSQRYRLVYSRKAEVA